MAFPARRNAGRAGRPQIHTLLSNTLRIRDAGAQSLGSTLFHEVRTCQWEELAIFHAVGKTAPQDPFWKEATHPGNEADGIAQRNKPQFLPCSGIAQAPSTCRPGQTSTQ